MAGDNSAGGEQPGIDYAELMKAALLDVVRRVLARTAGSGLPGEHHFLLSFGTTDDDVVLSPRLRRQYPGEMTIVLQHQYWGLEVDENGFSVTLRFGGTPERLVVPWSALRAFVDPSVGFALRLQPERPPAATATAKVRHAEAADAKAESPPSDKVVDFRAFRRQDGDDETGSG
jgi:hypothetical protein